MQTFLDRFDWESRSRVVEAEGRIAGAILLSSRMSPDGLIANLNLAGDPNATGDLIRWALGLSRAAGARIAQLFTARGSRSLDQCGLRVVRSWLRMDRPLDSSLPRVRMVAGYRLLDGRSVAAETWADIFNRSFADHWRYSPRTELEIVGGKPSELSLMAITAEDGEPAALTIAEVEDYQNDPRPAPVGLVSSVGTIPEHRRRGLAEWLVAEALIRLRAAGARTASLYVDGMSQSRAFDLYTKLGFEVAYEAEVWEASFP